MDFGVVAFDTLVCSNADTADHVNKYGSGFLNQDRTVNEDDLRGFKLPKTSSCSEATMKLPLQRCNNGAVVTESHQQMLSFSAQTVALPFYQQTSSAISRGAGYGYGALNGTSMYGVLSGVGGPFTPSQWAELEHQALIYKYITANKPIPSYLLNPIRKAVESCGFSSFSGLRTSALGWGAFHLGFSNTDPEPGRCRRTDGKKWRCSRDAVADQKYCERHMNRGRHRSRKPVESQLGHSASSNTTTNATLASVVPSGGASIVKQHNAYQDSSFRSVCSSDSLLSPINTNSSVVKCRNYSADGDLNDHKADRTRLSISIPIVTSDFVASSPTTEKLPASPSRLSWDPETTTQMGLGPLGEALHNNTKECKNAVALSLIDCWDHSPMPGSHPSRVSGTFGSGSRAESSKTLDADGFCNGLAGAGLILPTLPAL